MDQISLAISRWRTHFWNLRDRAKQRVLGRKHTAAAFTRIYKHHLWGQNESLSGPGSSLAATDVVRRELPVLFERLGVRILLDAPCGDFAWIHEIVEGLDHYKGVDIVPALIERNREAYASIKVEFICADICTDELPRAELVLCRDCFIHLPTSLIAAALRNFGTTGARYILLTNCSDAEVYHDIPIGSFRPINFTQPPFSFPAPLVVIHEAVGRELCLWDLRALGLP